MLNGRHSLKAKSHLGEWNGGSMSRNPENEMAHWASIPGCEQFPARSSRPGEAVKVLQMTDFDRK